VENLLYVVLKRVLAERIVKVEAEPVSASGRFV